MMSDVTPFTFLIYSWIFLAGIIFILLFFISAPYGRYFTRSWGPPIKGNYGWLIMESFAVVLFPVCFIIGNKQHSVVAYLFLGLWEIHYLYRAFIYPFGIKKSSRPMPVIIVFFAIIFNTGNAFINGGYLFTFSAEYPIHWFTDVRFIIGMILFFTGFIIHVRADSILRKLSQSQKGYTIPEGGLYNLISCPNYLGEIIEWTGWAVATWSIAGLSFAIWTAANLVPRALAHHGWYKRKFTEYPKERRALVPWII